MDQPEPAIPADLSQDEQHILRIQPLTANFIAFVNGKSGGLMGQKVITKLKKLIPPDQVYDLMEKPIGPKKGLILHTNTKDLKVICCGGDGTVGWVLSVIDEIPAFNQNPPQVSVIPLGTGNDLSRILRWGTGYGGEELLPVINNLVHFAVPVKMDRWLLHITDETLEDFTKGQSKTVTEKKEEPEDEAPEPEPEPEPSTTTEDDTGLGFGRAKSASGTTTYLNSLDGPISEFISEISTEEASPPQNQDTPAAPKFPERPSQSAPLRPPDRPKTPIPLPVAPEPEKPKDMVINNYFSIGIDSKVALDFHTLRTNHPSLFSSKYINMAWYGGIGVKAMLEPYSDLTKVLTMKIDGKIVPIPRGIKAIVLLNIPSYGGGSDPWGPSKNPEKRQSINDKRIEVLGLKGAAHVGRIQAHVSTGIRIGQAHAISFFLNHTVHAQVDGEPFFIGPCCFNVDFKDQATMLFNGYGDSSHEKLNKLQGKLEDDWLKTTTPTKKSFFFQSDPEMDLMTKREKEKRKPVDDEFEEFESSMREKRFGGLLKRKATSDDLIKRSSLQKDDAGSRGSTDSSEFSPIEKKKSFLKKSSKGNLPYSAVVHSEPPMASTLPMASTYPLPSTSVPTESTDMSSTFPSQDSEQPVEQVPKPDIDLRQSGSGPKHIPIIPRASRKALPVVPSANSPRELQAISPPVVTSPIPSPPPEKEEEEIGTREGLSRESRFAKKLPSTPQIQISARNVENESQSAQGTPRIEVSPEVEARAMSSPRVSSNKLTDSASDTKPQKDKNDEDTLKELRAIIAQQLQQIQSLEDENNQNKDLKAVVQQQSQQIKSLEDENSHLKESNSLFRDSNQNLKDSNALLKDSIAQKDKLIQELQSKEQSLKSS